MLPGIRPTVLGTLSIELVVVVCAVRVEMACGPGARQPLPTRHAWVGHPERSIPRSVSTSRIGIPFVHSLTLDRITLAADELGWGTRCRALLLLLLQGGASSRCSTTRSMGLLMDVDEECSGDRTRIGRVGRPQSSTCIPRANIFLQRAQQNWSGLP